MFRALQVAAGALLGLVVGYFGGAHLGCDWLYPTSNLCGLVGVFIGAPAGLFAGVMAVTIATRGKR
jgi:hypothetical protein